jgi:hypothetical protein
VARERLPGGWSDDVDLAVGAKANVLLVGSDARVERAIAALRTQLVEPWTTWVPGGLLLLPPPQHPGTLILRELGALDHQDQFRLDQWLDAASPRLQVVSTTRRSLLPRLRAGAFLERLYYRLNTVCLDLVREA